MARRWLEVTYEYLDRSLGGMTKTRRRVGARRTVRLLIPAYKFIVIIVPAFCSRLTLAFATAGLIAQDVIHVEIFGAI